MTTAEKIKKARKEAGLTQAKLAEKLNTTQQNLAQYESGKRKPKLETLDKIAEALSVDVWYFYDSYELEPNTLDKSKQLSSFLNYLDTLGYEFVDGTCYDAPANEVGMFQIKNENINIPLSQNEFNALEKSIKDDVILEIYRIRKEKNI